MINYVGNQYSVPTEYLGKSHSFKEEDIESRAKENLALLGGISGHEYNISAT